MNIKILLVCHKPSELPKNRLYMPIQVNSANATTRLEMEHDDNGKDNISAKNPEYCELTAQYWGWKNLKNVDYCGICHYRRFLCFKPTEKIPNIEKARNLRGHIEASVLNDYNMNRFGINDADEMEEIIRKYDVVVGEEQDVRKLYTPHGNQSTAYKHWVAHDRALIRKKDLDKMLDILCEESPEVGNSVRKYLNGDKFLGFNCFVAKKEIYDRLCELEFKVLFRLEKEVDLSSYSQQLTRIYGFMGEIISSGFFYYLEQTGKYTIKHVPIVYFNYTDPIKKIRPINNYSTPIIFNAADLDLIHITAEWQSFLESLSMKTKYSVIIFTKKDEAVEKSLTMMANNYDNLKLRFIDSESYRGLLFDKYGLKDDDFKQKKPDDFSNHLSLLPFFPYIFEGFKKAIVFNDNNLFLGPIDELMEIETNKILLAPRNIYITSMVNWIYPEYEYYLKQYLKNPLDYFSINAMVWDFEKSRKEITEEKIVRLLKNEDILRDKEETMNILYESKTDFLPQKWSVILESNDFMKNQLSYAPMNYYNEQKEARKNPSIITYLSNSEYDENYSDLFSIFWSFARKTFAYEWYLGQKNKIFLIREKKQKRNLLVKMFPVDGKARGKLTKIFPYDAKRTKKVKKILGRMGLR